MAVQIVEDFYGELARLPESRRVLEMLMPEELSHLKSRQAGYLNTLASETMTAQEQEAAARHVGWIHGVLGVDRGELIQGQSMIGVSTSRRLQEAGFDDPSAALFEQCLVRDLSWQLQAYQDLEKARQEILQRITKAAWDSRSYVDLINSVVCILISHKPIGSCAIGRPDAEGVFHFEAVAPQDMDSYYTAMLALPNSRITVHADQPGGQGPVGRAWREGKTERIVNFAKESQAAPWRAIAISQKLRSCIAIPLGVTDGRPLAVMLVHSIMPGGFIGAQQQAFFEMVRTLLDSAFARLDGGRGIHAATPFTARNHYAALVRSDALRMFYQPILDLNTWKVPKVEALVRLQDEDKLLAPGQFLEALNGDDLLEVYVRGLNQALENRRLWLQSNVSMDISINLPPAALGDIRYFDATRDALEKHACPASSLTLEVLENQAASLSMGRKILLESFRALGVLLAQDDLGAGQSGLSRLRQLPFDLIKIDRDMMTIDEANPLPTLRLVYQLSRLGHALGKKVLAEGVEHENWLMALVLLGVDMVQGYAIAKPMPAEELLPWLAKRSPEQCTARYEHEVPVRLAKLLLWSERLVVNYQMMQQLMACADTAHTGAALYDAMTSMYDMTPLTEDVVRARQELLEIIRDSGLHGQDTERAYQTLSAAVLSRSQAASAPGEVPLRN